MHRTDHRGAPGRRRARHPRRCARRHRAHRAAVAASVAGAGQPRPPWTASISEGSTPSTPIPMPSPRSSAVRARARLWHPGQPPLHRGLPGASRAAVRRPRLPPRQLVQKRPQPIRSEEPTRMLGYIAIHDVSYAEMVTADWTAANEVLADVWPVTYDHGADARWQHPLHRRPSRRGRAVRQRHVVAVRLDGEQPQPRTRQPGQPHLPLLGLPRPPGGLRHQPTAELRRGPGRCHPHRPRLHQLPRLPRSPRSPLLRLLGLRGAPPGPPRPCDLPHRARAGVAHLRHAASSVQWRAHRRPRRLRTEAGA